MSSIYQHNSNTLLLLARPKWHNIYMMPSAAARFVRYRVKTNMKNLTYMSFITYRSVH